MKRKILYVITKSNWGGAQRYVFDLALASRAEEYEVLVASGGNGPLLEELNALEIPTCLLSSFQRNISFFKDVSAFFETLLLIHKNKPDIIHLNSTKAGILGVLCGRLLLRPRIIFTVHGLPQFEDRPYLIRRFIGFCTWLTCALSHAVITITTHDHNVLESQLFLKKKLRLIPHGTSFVPLGKIEAREKIHAHMRDTEKKLLHTTLWIGTIAELHKNKGFEYALQAVALVAKIVPHVHYCIIGSGDMERQLKDLVTKLHIEKNVLFAGFISDARTLYPAFDIALLTSIKEGFPYTLIEAAYAGVPAVGTRIGGIPDIIDDRSTGILVPVREPQAIADAIVSLMQSSDLRQALGKQAFARAHTAYGLGVMTTCTLALYTDVLS